MATITLKLSQSVVDKNHALDLKYAQSPDDLNSLLDSVAKLDYAISSNYYYYSSYSSSGNTLSIKFPDGTTEKLTGTLDNPNSYYGYATVSSQTISIPNVLKATTSGLWRYYYNTYGSLSFQAVSGTAYKSSYQFLNNDVDFGKVGISFEGAVSSNYSNKNFSGSLTKISMTATQHMSSVVIDGNFNISGNLTTITQGSSSTAITGSISAYNAKYKDGSYVSVSGDGASINYVPNTEIGYELFANPLNWGGDDTINLNFPIILYDDIVIASGLGNDTIIVTGGANKVTINAGAGNDIITSKMGGHLLLGGTGDDTYIVDSTTDIITEYSGEGTDTIQSSVSFSLAGMNHVEVLTLTGSAAINATGNSSANIINGTKAANIIDGGGGSDILMGGAGNDTYYADNLDTIFDTAGIDTVITTSSLFTLTDSSNVENLTYSGSEDACYIFGNNLKNVITCNSSSGFHALFGNAGADTIVGSVSRDGLSGGEGKDILTGGDSRDWFYFDTPLNASTNLDRITDFSHIQEDTIGLDVTVFTRFTTDLISSLSSGNFVVGSKALDADDYLIYNKGTVYYDVDGSGSGKAIAFVKLDGAPILDYTDFTLYNSSAYWGW